MAKVKKADLVAAAEDLQKVMGIDQAPPVNKKESAIREWIEQAMRFFDPAGDEVSDETWEVLEALELAERPEEAEEEEAEEEDEPEEDDNSDEEDEEDGDTEQDLATTVANTKKLAELKELVKEHDEFKKLRKKLDDYQGLSGPRELKPAMFKALGVDPEEVQPKKAAKPAKKKVDKGPTRAEIMAKILKKTGKKPMTRKDMVDQMIEEYGGSDKEARFQVDVFCRIVDALGLFDHKDDGKLSYNN